MLKFKNKPVKNFLKKKLLFPLIGFFKQGITSKKLALTLALGLSIGVIPFFGINTLILLVLALILKLNIIAIQIVNYFVYPFQFILYIPFMKVGQFLFNGPELVISTREFIQKLRNNWWDFVCDIWYNNLLGLLVWLILAIPVSFFIYHYSLPIFKRYMHINNNS